MSFYSIKWWESDAKLDHPKIKAATLGVKGELKDCGTKSAGEILAAFERHAKQQGIHATWRSMLQDNPKDGHLNGLMMMSVGLSKVRNLKSDDYQDVAIVDLTPIRKVWYTPFPCMYQDCVKASRNRAGYAVEMTGVFNKSASTPLARYGDKICLYVVGHGDKKGDELMCDCGKHGFFGGGLDAYTLCERLTKDGLSQQVQEIRLWACKGGDVAPGQKESYAKMLASSAKNWFPNAAIYGYSGFLIITGGGELYSYADRDDEKTKVKAKERMQPFH